MSASEEEILRITIMGRGSPRIRTNPFDSDAMAESYIKFHVSWVIGGRYCKNEWDLWFQYGSNNLYDFRRRSFEARLMVSGADFVGIITIALSVGGKFIHFTKHDSESVICISY